MKRISNKLFLCSLTSLAALTTAVAHAEQLAYAPTLEGGITASIGTFYAVPGDDNYQWATTFETDLAGEILAPYKPQYVGTEYDWGFEASLGYIFDDTANGIELSYRGLNSDGDNSFSGNIVLDPTGDPSDSVHQAHVDFTNEFNSADLMVSQFLDIGDHVQMRFAAGLAYANIEQESDSFGYIPAIPVTEYSLSHKTDSEYQGWGPRLAIDGRYEFGDGFGIVAGASTAYLIGTLENSDKFTEVNKDAFGSEEPKVIFELENNMDNHTVLNVRGNVGIDYVYYLDDEDGAIGLELGYFADYYAEAVSQINGGIPTSVLVGQVSSDIISASYAGPYLLLKGAF